MLVFGSYVKASAVQAERDRQARLQIERVAFSHDRRGSVSPRLNRAFINGRVVLCDAAGFFSALIFQ